MDNKKVWYVTGASKGLGLALVKELLEQGYRVAATSRCQEALTEAIGTAEGFLPLEVDLTSDDSIARSIQATHATFGRIDVIVNNAGYPIDGQLEELSAGEIVQSFDINVFATIRVTQKALPYLRDQGSGHIINISSIAAYAGVTGEAIYSAGKAAVMGLSEVLAEDLAPLGIKVTVLAAGRYVSKEDKLMASPEKAAQVLVQLAEDPAPPVLLFLGKDAWYRAAAKATHVCDQLEEWKAISFSTAISPVHKPSFHPSY